MTAGPRVICSAILAAALITATSSAAGCARAPRTTVVSETESAENTSSISALQRGKERRAALDAVRTGIDAWDASDAAGMKKYFASDVVKRFERTWEDYAAEGLSIRHVHEVSYLDVTEMNKSGTQAIVTYSYKDTSYLVDASGDKARELPVIDKDMQLTLEKNNGAWSVTRVIAVKEAYR